MIEESNGSQAPLDILIFNKSYRLLCTLFLRTKGLCTQLIFQFEINFFVALQTNASSSHDGCVVDEGCVSLFFLGLNIFFSGLKNVDWSTEQPNVFILHVSLGLNVN